MIKFDWLTFIEDVEVVLMAPNKVKSLAYFEIQIHPYPHALLVGAYKFVKESRADALMINYFETHGILIHAIISAIEQGLAASPEQTEASNLPAYFNSDNEIMQAAFNKGKSLQQEAQEQFHIRNMEEENEH